MTRINVTTRTGKKVHEAYATSAVTRCGRWLRVAAIAYRIDAPVTCERCMDPNTNEDQVPADPRHAAIREALENAKTLADVDAIKAEYKLTGWDLRLAFFGEMDVDEAITRSLMR